MLFPISDDQLLGYSRFAELSSADAKSEGLYMRIIKLLFCLLLTCAVPSSVAMAQESAIIAFRVLILSGFRSFESEPTKGAPQVFALGVISTGKEFGMTFTPDGKEAYFTRSDTEKKITHIYRSKFSNGQWQAPTALEFSSEVYSDLDASITSDGKRLFFVSTRPRPGMSFDPANKNMDIWVANRIGNKWTEPHWVENVNSDAKEGSPSVARDGTLYFFSDRNASANTNSIYVAKLINGHYGKPTKLPSPINSDASDTSPFISPKGTTLLFYSTRAGGYGGADLYVSHIENGSWTEPLNLGASVNTKDWEYNPSLSPDGRLLYFGRNRQIYVVATGDVEVLRQLRTPID